MKFTENDIKELVKNIKEFKAGVIDRKLDEHIDKCVEELKDKVKKKRWWKIF